MQNIMHKAETENRDSTRRERIQASEDSLNYE